MKKKIFNHEELTEGLKNSLTNISSILGQTLGPKGRHVIYDKFDNVHIVDDGTTIADEICFDNLLENAIAKVIAKTSRDANNLVGDGSTTTSILSCALTLAGLRFTKLGYNSAFIKKGLEKVSNFLIEHLKDIKKNINGKKDIESVANISSNDLEIGKLIADATEKVGENGLITVQESNSFDTTIEISNGMEIDKGMFSPYFANSQDKNEFFAKNVSVFVTDQSLNTPEQTFKLLEAFSKQQTGSLLIIGEDIKPEALLLLLANKYKKGLNICFIKTPSFGDNRREILEDICAITNAKLFSKENSYLLNNISPEVFGFISSVKSTNSKTTLITEESTKNQSQLDRQDILTRKLLSCDSKIEREKLEERIAKLNGAIAVINVGASTETEMKSKKLKIEDALNATKAAIEEGVVIGGGMTMFNLSFYVIEKKDKINLQGDELCAIEIFAEALRQPIKHILLNAGTNPDLVMYSIDRTNPNNGFDVVNLRHVNMLETGIIDCTKVIRTALQTASSTAGMLLTSGSAILEQPSKNNESIPNTEMPY